MKDYLRLVRAPLAFTAIADVLAGAAVVAGGADRLKIGPLLAAIGISVCFYSAGMAWNDYVDRETDRVDFPRRPIPSGRIAPFRAGGTVMALLLGAFVLSVLAGPSPFLCSILFLSIAAYNLGTKRWAIPGAITLAICRGLNFGLGYAAGGGETLPMAYPLILIAYIFTLSMVSTLEDRSPELARTIPRVMRFLLYGISVVDAAIALAAGQPVAALAILALALPAWGLSAWLRQP